MPQNTIQLPKDHEALCVIVNNHFDRERRRMMPELTMFRIIKDYLAGIRRFNMVNLNEGTFQSYRLDKDGNLEFQSADLMKAVDQVVGHLSSYDYSPVVKNDSTSLSAMREGAVGQVIADAIFDSDATSKAVRDFNYIYTSLGSCGMMVYVENDGLSNLHAGLEVVHPREIVPFPALDQDLTKQRGIGRESYITMAELKKKIGARKFNAKEDDLYWFQLEIGREAVTGDPSSAALGTLWQTNVPAEGSAPNRDDTTAFVRIRELWLDGPRGTCSRKITVSGRVVLQDLDFTDLEVYCPLVFRRFMDNGTFYGAGMYHVLFMMSRQLELMHKKMFKDIIDRDEYGFLVLPQGSVNVNMMAKPPRQGLNVLGWEPDSLSGNDTRPFFIEPHTVGPQAERVATYAKGYFDSLNPLVDIIREKGRVDSQTGLQYMQELVEKAMTSPTQGVASMFTHIYRAGLSMAGSELVKKPDGLPIYNLTLDLAGAVIDWDRGTVSFKNNPLPTMSRLRCRPKLSGNKSVSQRKNEGLMLLERGIITRNSFVIKAFEENWDLAGDLTPELNAYHAVIRNLLTLFNDGIEPGEMAENPQFARPDIQLPVVDSFLSSYKVKLASPEVQDELNAYKKFLIEQTGRTLPEQLPFNPEDAAIATSGQSQAFAATQQR